SKRELSYQDMDKFYKIFYSNDELREKVTVRAKDLLWEIIRKEFGDSGAISIDDLSQYLQNYELDIMVDIQNALPKENDPKIIVSSEQRNFIKEWCLKNSEKVKAVYSSYMFDSGSWLEED